jgi:hypothetical protein
MYVTALSLGRLEYVRGNAYVASFRLSMFHPIEIEKSLALFQTFS